MRARRRTRRLGAASRAQPNGRARRVGHLRCVTLPPISGAAAGATRTEVGTRVPSTHHDDPDSSECARPRHARSEPPHALSIPPSGPRRMTLRARRASVVCGPDLHGSKPCSLSKHRSTATTRATAADRCFDEGWRHTKTVPRRNGRAARATGRAQSRSATFEGVTVVLSLESFTNARSGGSRGIPRRFRGRPIFVLNCGLDTGGLFVHNGHAR